MNERNAHDKTVLDPRMAPIRLKQGLIPGDTGIYLRIEQGPDAGTVVDLSPGGVYLIGREGAGSASTVPAC